MTKMKTYLLLLLCATAFTLHGEGGRHGIYEGQPYALVASGKRSLEGRAYGLAIQQFLGLLAAAAADRRLALEVYEGLSRAYAGTKNFSIAMQYHKLHTDLSDSLFIHEAERQIEVMEARYKSEEKEEQIKMLSKSAELQVAELARKRVVMSWVLAGIVVCVCAGLVVFTRYRLTHRQGKLIQRQKALVDEAYGRLHEKNQEILDSIYYARRIQRALITSEKYIDKSLARLVRR